MVWAGINYRQRAQLNLIDGNLNAQRNRDEILISCYSMIMHSPMLQGSVYNSWKLKLSQFFYGLHTHHTCHQLSMFGMLWIDMYKRVFQFPPISNFAQSLKKSGTTFHRPQSTT
ncbi:unnamed protein product [Oncorhynchus mykiss]|uniref:Uncharacterized protein n=1 Tax=Oncorhynchus mykiss TaxID=8022 RepID=A0A060Z670_ONCMY|nr:unnamed protein product [Oncorhynchus mykiss]